MSGDWIFPEIYEDDYCSGIGEASYSGDDAVDFLIMLKLNWPAKSGYCEIIAVVVENMILWKKVMR
jgi:hypothetical protein